MIRFVSYSYTTDLKNVLLKAFFKKVHFQLFKYASDQTGIDGS